jgi:hypothetical protein
VRGHGSAVTTQEGEAFAHEVKQTFAGLDYLGHAARRIRDRGPDCPPVACQPSLASRRLPRFDAECLGLRVSVHVPSPDAIWS